MTTAPVDEAARRAAALISAEVRSVLDVTLAQAEEIRGAAQEQGLTVLRAAYQAAHDVRRQVDELAEALAGVLGTARAERARLAAELRIAGWDGESFELTAEPQPLLELTSGDSSPEAAPTAEAPVAEEPVAEAPVAEEPVAEEPVAEEPVAEAPVAEEPVAEEPVAGTPAAKVPVAEESPAEAPPAEGRPALAEEPSAQREAGSSADRTVAGIPPPTRFLDLPTDNERGRAREAGAPPEAARLGARACMTCNGTGRCAECSGRGKRLRFIRCEACEGTGSCPRCHGRGTLGRSITTG